MNAEQQDTLFWLIYEVATGYAENTRESHRSEVEGILSLLSFLRPEQKETLKKLLPHPSECDFG